VLALAVLPSTAWPATVVIGAAKDNSIFESNSNNSAGGSAGIFSGTNGMGSPRRGLIEFDVAAHVPAGATITGVELTLYLGNAPNSDNQSIGLHRLTREWGEGTAGSSLANIAMAGMGFPADPGDATWSHAVLDSAAWTNAGAMGDFSGTASASTVVNGPIESPFTWSSTAALVNDVQGWLDSPASNYGWALINGNETTIRSNKAFYSREATQNSSGVANSLDPAWRPSLLVTYLAPPTGDYNGNGVVDAADYVVWRKTLNLSAVPAGSGADGNENGTIEEGDYDYWNTRFGTPITGHGNSLAVPEPASFRLLLIVGPLAFLLKRR
jgi:hypothetical protein